MSASPLLRRRLVAVAACSLLSRPFGAMAAVRREFASPLEQAASMSRLAPAGWLTKVVRAGRRLVAIGERGIALWSDDDGRNWQQARVPVSVTLTSAVFADERTGWAAGHAGVVLHTRNAGETWERQMDGVTFAKAVLEEVQRMPASAPQREQHLKRAQSLVNDGPDKPFLALEFADARRGVAVGAYGLAAATHDGGTSWQPMMAGIDNPRGMHLYGVARSGLTWAMAGEQGYLARSMDDAKTFSQVESHFKGSFFTLAALRDGGMLAAGLLGNACCLDPVAPAVADIQLPSKVTILSVTMIGRGRVVLLESSGRLLIGSDTGRSFDWVSMPQQGPLTSVVAASDGTLVATGPRGVRRLPIDMTKIS